MSAVRNADTKMITVKGHLDAIAGQPQGTIMNYLGKTEIFKNLSTMIEADMFKFFKGKEDNPITFKSNEDGDFKITIYDPKSITSLTDGQNRSFLMD